MKNTLGTGFLIRGALLYFTLAGVCQAIEAQSEIRFRLVHGTVVVVSLAANEEGPFDFVLDTGTNTSIVDPVLARRLSLPSIDHIQLSTLAGSRNLIRSSIRVLGAGSAKAQDMEVVLEDLAELRKLDPHIQGVVGQNFLSHFNYLLDYRKHFWRIEASDEILDSIEGDPVPMEVSENKMMVASEAQSGRKAKLRLLLDSGANALVLLHRASQALDFPTLESWVETTNGGQGERPVGRFQVLTVGSEHFHDVAVALPPAAPADAERVEDGAMPTALFRAIYVNNRGGFVVFNPRTKKN